MRLVQAIQFRAKYGEVRMVAGHISRARLMPGPMSKSVGHPCGARVWEASLFHPAMLCSAAPTATHSILSVLFVCIAMYSLCVLLVYTAVG
jgi:hypothetical protein